MTYATVMVSLAIDQPNDALLEVTGQLAGQLSGRVIGVAAAMFAVLLALLLGISGLINLVFKKNVDCTIGPHHRNLGSRPGIIDIAPNVLTAHHIVCPTIGFTRNDR